MNCNESNDYIMKHLDGKINDIESAQLKQHVKSCKGCSESFESLNEIFSFIESDNSIEPPQDFEVKVMEKINVLETKRKKRADGVLVLLYSFVTVLLTTLSIAFVAKYNEINVLDILKRTSESFSSLPQTFYTLYSIISAIYTLALRIIEAAFQVIGILSNTYYFAFAILLIAFIMLQPVIVSFVKQGGREKK